MRDEHDRRARVGELTHDRHELVRLLRGQHGRRFIQDQDLRLTRQRLDDLDALLRTNRQILDQRIRIQVESESRRHLAHSLARAFAADDAGGTRRFKAERNRLGHGKDRNQHEVLVNHADTRGDRVARSLERHGLPVDEDLPFIGLMHPVQDVHECGLARSVLSEQGVDVPLLDRQVDRVIGGEGTKPLRDPPQL